MSELGTKAGRPALVNKIAKELHENTGMRSVRWCDLGASEKALRIEQASVAVRTIENWAREMREPWLNLMDTDWFKSREGKE